MSNLDYMLQKLNIYIYLKTHKLFSNLLYKDNCKYEGEKKSENENITLTF